MISREVSSFLSVGKNPELAQAAEELTRLVAAGDEAAIEAALTGALAPHQSELRQLLPAMRMLTDLSGQTFEQDDDNNGDRQRDRQHFTGTLGDFHLIREIGRGGMGIVYEAEQISLSRRVAVKVLPLASVMDERQLQRFKNEAISAASLKHPQIVTVFFVGCDRGVHYYAMQLIEGRTLADLIAELADQSESLAFSQDPTSPSHAPDTKKHYHSTQKSSPQSAAYYRQVAQFGIQAAEALEHAHQCGVIHRDIKPSNLLIDATGHLWVADFGLAKIETSTNLTLTGDLVGTLRYMSPEQVRGRPAVIDERTDIYSLGITLYELATLRPAIPATDRHELLRAIIECDPLPPRKFARKIPRDLETIILKAIANDPKERYSSAKALAADLTEFISGNPISARRVTLSKAIARWSQRHRTIIAAVVATIILCLTASSVALRFAYDREVGLRNRTEKALEGEKRERTNATIALAGESRERLRSEAALRQLYSALQSMSAGFGDSDWNVLSSYYLHPGQREMAKSIVGFYEDFIKKIEGNNNLADLLPDAYIRLGKLRFLLQDKKKTDHHFASALTLLREAYAKNPSDAALRIKLSQSLLLSAHVRSELFSSSKDSLTPQLYQEAVDVVRVTPSSKELDQQLFASLVFRARYNYIAKRDISEDIQLTNDHAARFPADALFMIELKAIENDWHWNHGRTGLSRAAIAKSISCYQSLIADSPHNLAYRWGLARTYLLSAKHHRYMGLPAKALEDLAAARQLTHTTSGSRVSQSQELDLRAEIAIRMSEILCEANTPVAIATLSDAEAQLKTLVAENPPFAAAASELTAYCWVMLAAMHERLGNRSEAVQFAKLATSKFQTQRHLRGSADQLWSMAIAIRNGADAADFVTQVDAIRKQIPPSLLKYEHLMMINAARRQRNAQLVSGQSTFSTDNQSIDLDDTLILSSWEKFAGNDPKQLAPLALHLCASNPERAVKIALRAVANSQKDTSPGRGPRAWHTLGICYVANHQLEKALEALQTAEEWGWGGPYIPGENYYYRSICLWHLGRHDEARAMFAKAEAWGDENGHAYATEPVRWEARALVNDL